MNHQTIEQMVEWLTPDEYGNGVMADVTLDYTKSTAIRVALTAQALPEDGNRLTLEEIPEGWEFRIIEKIWAIDAPAAHYCCILDNPDHDDITANGATPAEALRAAIQAAKDGAS